MKNAQLQPLILMTCIFAAFIFGLCGGRNLNRTPVQIHTLTGVTAVTAASNGESADTAATTGSVTEAETEFVGPGVVNINTATAEQLQLLEGIGPVLAERIVTYRETYGDFQSIGEFS